MNATDSSSPKYAVGDVINGHRLTQQPDGSVAWLPVAGEGAPAQKKSRKGLWITVGVVGGLVVVGSIGVAVNGVRGVQETAADKPAPAEVVDEEPEAEPESVDVAVPDVTGKTGVEAFIALAAAGFEVAPADDPTAIVVGTTPAAGTLSPEGSTVTLTMEQKPTMTVGQDNALRSAKSYLDYMGFSRSGLIKQLEYEGFATEDATFAADSAGADWAAEAGQSATNYMSTMSFSREGLYDQLIYEGFSDAEANAGLAAVGY